MTVEDLSAYPDDGYRYELVEGVLIRVAGSRPKAGRITRRLFRQLDTFVRERGLGVVTLPDEVYDFEHTGQPNTGLLPDIGFYYAFREGLVEDDKPYPFAPDLAIEIASRRRKSFKSIARSYATVNG
jgi:Uma2 family endonuclease